MPLAQPHNSQTLLASQCALPCFTLLNFSKHYLLVRCSTILYSQCTSECSTIPYFTSQNTTRQPMRSTILYLALLLKTLLTSLLLYHTLLCVQWLLYHTLLYFSKHYLPDKCALHLHSDCSTVVPKLLNHTLLLHTILPNSIWLKSVLHCSSALKFFMNIICCKNYPAVSAAICNTPLKNHQKQHNGLICWII